LVQSGTITLRISFFVSSIRILTTDEVFIICAVIFEQLIREYQIYEAPDL